MNINDAFSGSFLKAGDLKGKDVTLTITKVEMTKVGEDEKAVVQFAGTDRSLVLNKINASVISDQLGPETDTWTGKTIVLFPTTTEFAGRVVDCIRVRPAAVAVAPAAPAPLAVAMPSAAELPDSAIPF